MGKESEPEPHSLSSREVVSLMVAAYGHIDSPNGSHGYGGPQNETRRRDGRSATATVWAGAVAALAALLTTCSN